MASGLLTRPRAIRESGAGDPRVSGGALRLLLGSDAVFLAGVVAAARAAEDARWKPLSMSTDYEGLVDFAETPIAKMLMATRS